MAGEVNIPDEAWQAADKAADQAVRWDADGNEHYGRHGFAVVEAAAPHIDRAARVDELKRLAGKIGRQADECRHDERGVHESSVLEGVHTQISHRIVELEDSRDA
jgi:hypothetical protein